MSKVDVVRAWKDSEYRAGLSDAERASLPRNPAGAIELTEAELEGVAGGSEAAITLNSSTCKFGSLGCSCSPVGESDLPPGRPGPKAAGRTLVGHLPDAARKACHESPPPPGGGARASFAGRFAEARPGPGRPRTLGEYYVEN